MNSFIKNILLFSAALFCVACVDTPVPDGFHPTEEAHYLEISQSNFSIDAKAFSKKIELNASHPWFFTDYAEWISLSKNLGNTSTDITLSVQENHSADVVRSNIFQLMSEDPDWKFSKNISVNQRAAIPYIITSLNELNVSGHSSNHRIEVSANTKWTAQWQDNWFSVIEADDDNFLDISISENLTNKSRQSIIQLQGGTTGYITINQQAANISTETNTLEYSQSGGSYLLNISSEVSWAINTEADWIEVTPNAGSSGEESISVSTLPNWSTKTRSALLDIYIGNEIMANILVKQEGVNLYTTKDEDLLFEALGGENKMHLESNISWRVLSKPNWITISPESGNKSTDLSISADNNTESTQRSGMVVIGQEGLAHTASFVVTQDGKYFSLNNESLAIGSTGGYLQVSMETNDEWSVKFRNPIDWLSLSDSIGKKSASIRILAEDNPSVNPRSAIVDFIPNDLDTIKIVVRQKARFLQINTNGIQFFSKGGDSSPITITTDGEYTISEHENWFSVNNNGHYFCVNAEPNTTGHTRKGIITISLTDLSEGSISLSVEVIQTAPGGVFSKDDFSEDHLWDATLGKGISISVDGYRNDEDWDAKDQHHITLSIDGYKGDGNWDGKTGSGTADKEDYPEDEDNNVNEGFGTADKEDYPEDDDYGETEGCGIINKDDYPEEDNYDNDSIKIE